MMRILPVALLLLTGCASDGGRFPSLGVRPAESLGFAEPEVTETVAAPDPALDASVAALRSRLDAATRGYANALSAAETSAARTGARSVGSEAWLSAQSALAQLDDWRAQTTALASEADALAIERARALQPPAASLTTLAAALRAEQDRQTSDIDRLQQLVPPA